MSDENRVEHRIPTTQYGYISVYAPLGTPLTEELIQTTVSDHNRLIRAFEVKAGLPDKEMDAFIERQISGGSNHIEEYNAMNDEQKKYVQCIKRAMNRINYKLTHPKE